MSLVPPLRELPQLEICPLFHPSLTLGRERRSKLQGGVLATAEPGERQAVLISPAGELAERTRPGIGLEFHQALLDRGVRFNRTAGSQRRASGFEPEETIAGELLLKLADYAQGVRVSLFAVVDDDEAEARVGLNVACEGRGVLDQTDPPLPASGKTDKVRDQPFVKRQG